MGPSWLVRKVGNRPWDPRAEGKDGLSALFGSCQRCGDPAPLLSQHFGPALAVSPECPHLPGFPVLTQPSHGCT